MRVRLCALPLVALVVLPPARGQAVISTHSGLVHYFDGAVSVAGKPLVAHLGMFASIPEGAELRTEQGRAEVLLTPGVFLRVGQNSAIRMNTTALQDTRVALLAGSAIVETGDPAPGTSVTVLYKDWSVRLPQKGVYRFDYDPARLEVHAGEAEVSAAGAAPLPVDAGMALPFATALKPEKLTADSSDALTDWADGRDQSISADNSIAADIQDPASMTGPDSMADSMADGFTYFPMLGLSAYAYSPSLAYGAGMYGGSMGMYQAGFYSMYLPGYAFLPSFMRLPFGTSTPLHMGIAPAMPPRIGIRPTMPGVHVPAVRPVAPAPIHVGVHVGGRR